MLSWLRCLIPAATALCALTVVVPPAQALTLPDATSTVSCALGAVMGSWACRGSRDSIATFLEPYAAIRAEADYLGGFQSGNGLADGLLTFSWAVVGGQPGDLVPIDIAILFSVGAWGPQGLGYASAKSTTGPSGTVASCASTDGSCGANHTQLVSNVMRVVARSGEVNTFQLRAKAVGVYGADSNGGVAWSDPYFFVDPAFARAGDYALLLSAGVGNAPAMIPEPPVSALLGLGLTALALRRRNASSLRR